MPLICENVAAYAIKSGNAQGDLSGPKLLYFDPDSGNKDKRREKACGCFAHDDCVGSGTSNGKRAGVKVTDIAGTFPTISPAAVDIIKAGTNPKSGEPRETLSNVPGRFFAQGVGFTCDEFPPATFIEGGDDARTICALQSWQVYSGSESKGNVGKWPLQPRSGARQEQDWQASVHAALRLIFKIGSTKKKTGWGTVYPFQFSTTTLKNTDSKAWVIGSPQTTRVISKRNAPPQTLVSLAPVTTINVSGDEQIDKRNPGLGGQPSNTHIYPRNIPAVVTATPTSPSLPVRSAAALFPRASECSLDFDRFGQEDVEVGDPGNDPDLPGDASAPQCGEGSAPQEDVQAINDDLDARGNDQFDNCCGGSGCPIVATHGLASVNLCGDQNQCIGCAQLANYVQGIIDTCGSDGKVLGTQDINEAPGLQVRVDILDTI